MEHDFLNINIICMECLAKAGKQGRAQLRCKVSNEGQLIGSRESTVADESLTLGG